MTHSDSARATIRTVRVGDADIHVTEWGAGPPVLLLHGNPDSGIMWEGVADRMAAQYRCIAPDLSGFGHSQVPSHFQRSLEGLAQFVEQFLAAADIARPVDLIAHDFGGPFAFAWAVKHPDSIRRMVAINTLFFSDYRWHFWARVWRTPILGELSMLGLNRMMFARELRRASKALSDAHIDQVWDLVTPSMKQEVLRLYRATDSANFRLWESEFLKLVRAKPTLVIWGDKDPYVSSRFAERSTPKRWCTLRKPVIGPRSKRRTNAPTLFCNFSPHPPEARAWTPNSSATCSHRSARSWLGACSAAPASTAKD